MKTKGQDVDNQTGGGQPDETGRTTPRRGRKAQAISAGASGTLATIRTRSRLAENGPDHGDGDESPRDAGALGRDSGQSVAAAEAASRRGASRETPSPKGIEKKQPKQQPARYSPCESDRGDDSLPATLKGEASKTKRSWYPWLGFTTV